MFLITPATLRAAADTNSKAVVVEAKTSLAVNTLPPTAKSKLPGSAALSIIQPQDPHPLVTEFFGPANKAKKPAAKPATDVKPLVDLTEVR
ncbi:MAG TPA: hypothetical protein VM056_04725 [Terriglobales bacterium]|nr:hypothetical protein [Terriglobales bacterium]